MTTDLRAALDLTARLLHKALMRGDPADPSFENCLNETCIEARAALAASEVSVPGGNDDPERGTPAPVSHEPHRLLLPPHPGEVYASSALCSCGEWQFDSGSFHALMNEYGLILRLHTEHVRGAPR